MQIDLPQSKLSACCCGHTERGLDLVILTCVTIPRGRAKNCKVHRVPLSASRGSLPAGHEAFGESEFVFPGDRNLSHVASRSVSKAMERTRAKLGPRETRTLRPPSIGGHCAYALDFRVEFTSEPQLIHQQIGTQRPQRIAEGGWLIVLEH